MRTTQPERHRTVLSVEGTNRAGELYVREVALLGVLSAAEWRAMLAFSLPVDSGMFDPHPMLLPQLAKHDADASKPLVRLVAMRESTADAVHGVRLWGTAARWLERWFSTQGPLADARLASCQRAHWHCDCRVEAVLDALERGRVPGGEILPLAWDAAHRALGRAASADVRSAESIRAEVCSVSAG